MKSEKQIKIDLGQTLRKLRLAIGFTQEQLAELSETHRTYLGDLERGRNNVSILTLAKISEQLGVTIAELCDLAEI